MSSFKISKRVLCVNGTFDSSVNNLILFKPQKGQMYTIREIVETPNGTGILLDEIVNKPIQFRNCLKEPSFLTSRFRLVDELGSKEDASILENIQEEVFV